MNSYTWPATGRWRVKQYLAPHRGPNGGPQLRYAVIDPSGRHVVSSHRWWAAQELVQELARDMEREL